MKTIVAIVFMATIAGCAGFGSSGSAGHASSEYGLDGYHRNTGLPIPAGR